MAAAGYVRFLFAAAASCCICCAQGASHSYYKDVYPPVDLSQDLSKHLFFALVQSFGSEFNGSGNIAGVQVALDRVNSNSSILPNHTLHYTLTDSQVRASRNIFARRFMIS